MAVLRSLHRCSRRWARQGWLVSISLVALVVATVAQATPAHAGTLRWHADQDNCAALMPHGVLYNNHGGVIAWPYGQEIGEFTWDGQHKIVACNNDSYATSPGPASHDNRAFYADGQEARSGANYVSGGYGAAFQCEELIQRYAFARWGDAPSAWGHGASATWMTHPSHFAAIPNGSSQPPLPGDILVWQSNHIAIVTSVGPRAIVIFQENMYWPTLRPPMDGATSTISYHIAQGHYLVDSSDLAGWLHAADTTGAGVAVLATNTGIGGGKGIIPPRPIPSPSPTKTPRPTPTPTPAPIVPTNGSALAVHGVTPTWTATTSYLSQGSSSKSVDVTLSFSRDATGALWYAPLPGQPNAAQLPLPTAPVPFASDPIAARDGAGVLRVYATGTDGLIYALAQDDHLQKDGTPAWTKSWQVLPPHPAGATFVGAPGFAAHLAATARDSLGALAVLVARDSTGSFWYLPLAERPSNAPTWQELTLPKGDHQPFASDPVVNTGPSGSFTVVALDAEGHEWQTTQQVDAHHPAWPMAWTGWQELPAAAVPFIGQPALGTNLPVAKGVVPLTSIVARGIDGNLYALTATMPDTTGAWVALPPLPLPLLADPAIIADATNHLTIVAVTTDGALWRATLGPMGKDGPIWQAWQGGAASATADAAPTFTPTAEHPAVIWQDGTISLITHSATGTLWQTAAARQGAWRAWSTAGTLPQPVIDPSGAPTVTGTSTPSSWTAAVPNASGADVLLAFTRDAAGQIHVTGRTGTATTIALPNSVPSVGNPTAVVNDAGDLTVYTVGTDGSLWADTLPAWQTGTELAAWSGWTSLSHPDDGMLSGTPGAIILPAIKDAGTAAWGATRLVAARDKQGHVWAWHMSLDGQHQGWQRLTRMDGKDLVAASDPVVTLNLDQAVTVTVTDTNGGVWQTWQTGITASADATTEPVMQWSGWQAASVGPVAFTGAPALGSELFAPARGVMVLRSQTGQLFALGESALDGAQPAPLPFPFPAVGVTFTSDPTVAVDANNLLNVFAIGSDGALWHATQIRTYAPGGTITWSAWERLARDGVTFTGSLGDAPTSNSQPGLLVRDTTGKIWQITLPLAGGAATVTRWG